MKMNVHLILLNPDTKYLCKKKVIIVLLMKPQNYGLRHRYQNIPLR